MKTIIAITHLTQDVQVELVFRYATLNKIRVITLCTNTVSFESIGLRQKKGEIDLLFDGEVISPDGLWFATYPREDTLYSKRMSKYPYPGEYRSTVLQFINDLRYAFPDAKHLPGTFDLILRADSKPFIFREASRLGLNIPNETINGNLRMRRITTGKKILYRKKLGFPSTVSFSALSGKEEIITTTNTLSTKDSSFLLWQWQTPIESVAHIRGVIVGEKSWFVSWRRKSNLKSTIDLREGGVDREWEPFELPVSVAKKLANLREILGVQFCCPEFLFNKKGELTLIDINPCGDWYGFFPEERSREIASAIANVL